MNIYKTLAKRKFFPLSVMLAAVLAACGSGTSSGSAKTTGSSTSSPTSTSKPITIGIDLYTQTLPRWTNWDENYFKQDAKKLGVKVVFRFANGNLSTQGNDIRTLLAQHVNALIVSPVDVKSMGKFISEAKAQNVPFVDYDISVPNALPSYVVVRNQDQACQSQLSGALKFAPSGNYVLMPGDAGIDLAQACQSVYKKTLANHPNVHVVFDNWVPGFSQSTALTDAENILTKYNGNIKAFVVSNDTMALGVMQALKERGLQGKVYVSGLDADPPNIRAIYDGYQNMTIWTPINLEAKAALNAAVALAKHQKPSSPNTFHNQVGTVPATFIPNVVVNKNNVCSFLKNDAPPFNGLMTISKIFPNNPNACAGNK